MKVNPTLIRLPIKYGLFSMGLIIVAFLVFYYLGQQPWRNLLSMVLDVLLIGGFCFAVIKDFKTNYNNGELRFYQGMTLGFISYLLVALGFSIFYWFFMKVIAPDFIAEYISLAMEDMVNRKDLMIKAMGEESYHKQLSLLKETTVSVIIGDAFIKKVIAGFILTPVFSVVMRTSST